MNSSLSPAVHRYLKNLLALGQVLRLGGPRKICLRFWKRLRFTHDLVRALKPATRLTEAYPIKKSIFKEVEPETVLREIRSTGLYSGFSLPSPTVSEILDFVRRTPCNGGFGGVEEAKILFFPEQRREKERESGKKLIMGHYPQISSRLETIRALEQDPKILSIAASYLGGHPLKVHTMLWWSFATDASERERLDSSQTVRFHFDEFDYRFLYFSFYLTDVDKDSGAHVCVLGSHTRKSLVHLFSPASHSDEAISRYYGRPRIVTLTGKAGFGFVEDAFCFHKATPPQSRDRLFLQIRMGISPEKV